ncbi:ankyrin repeat domain-containing protein 33B-like [Oscarella lobularis]|uniref:ankyrin repeat domain-containing protein 33B-like n=1 Tax=Oscarella lobularis TaxID=121494 RepID=UPI003314384B
MVDERKTRSRRQSTTSSASTSGPHSPHRRKAFAVVVVDAEMLFEAIATGASRRLRKYLNEGGGGGGGGSNAANVRDDAHRTLLMRICYLDEAEKRETMTRIVVEHGCNVNAQDELGRTALTYAALFGRDDVVNYLVEKGADALIEDVDGNGPLYHCASVGNAEIAWTLIKAYGGRGLNVNKRNLQGMTPLLQAAKLGHVHCAKVLVTEGGASTTVRDLDGFMNAEEWARFSGRFSNDDILLLSPIVAKKMRCKEHRRSLGRKILSDYFIGGGSTSNETKSGLIRQSFNTFHFVSQSDPEAVSSDDESAVTATSAAVAGSLSYVASTSAPNLPLLAGGGGGGGGGSNVWSSLSSSSAASSPVSPSSQKSMFQIQLPKVKPPQLDGSGHETAAATAAATRLHKIHTIREEDTTAGKKTGSGCIKMTPTPPPPPPPPPPLATDSDNIAVRLPSVSNNRLSFSSSSVAAGSSTLTLPYSSSPKTGKAIRRRTTGSGSSPLSKDSTMNNGGGSRSPRRSKSKSI